MRGPDPNGLARPFPEGRGMASGSRGRWGRDGAGSRIENLHVHISDILDGI